MDLAVYAHPFDLDALAQQGGLRRLRDLGFSEVALATSYHDGRWLMPWHPKGRVRFLEDGTVHFRPRADYGVLRPKVASFVAAAGPSPLERLCQEAPAAGLRVRAWNVFTHNSRLGTMHPELCVENAFGDRYVYALCPAQPAVQQYMLGLVSDLAAHAGLGAIELEALGWMGWKHSSHHDKASFTPGGVVDYAMSLCFCSACCAHIARDGGDPARARSWAREIVRTSIEDADAMAPPTVVERADAMKLDEPAVAVGRALSSMLRGRVDILSDLGKVVCKAMPPTIARAVQVHPSALFTGSQLPIMQTVGLRADEYVFTAYGENAAAIKKLFGGEQTFLIEKPEQRKRLSIWPKAPQFTSDEDLTKVRAICEQHGIASVAIYHLGLLPWRTIERVAKMFGA